MVRKAIGAVDDPYGLDHRDDADEAGIIPRQPALDQLRRLGRLNGVVLREVADENVGVEPDHRRLARGVGRAAPAAAAALISSIVTGRRPGLTMPRKAEAGSFGKRTTLPSGCTKNLTRSPGFNRRCSRMAFGIVAWPLAVIADSMVPPLHFIECNTLAPARTSNCPRIGTFSFGRRLEWPVSSGPPTCAQARSLLIAPSPRRSP